MNDIAATIEKECKAELLIYADKIREFSKRAIEICKEGLTFDRSNVNAIAHGDFWTTNMLFRYNDEGLPQSIRLIDFQQSSYKSVGMELHFFFNTSLNAEALSRRGDLVQIYYDSLVSTFSKHGLSDKAPSLKDVLDTYNKGYGQGLVTGLALRPSIVQPAEAIPDDMEQYTKDTFNEDKNKLPKVGMKNMWSVLGPLLEHATSVGVL